MTTELFRHLHMKWIRKELTVEDKERLIEFLFIGQPVKLIALVEKIKNLAGEAEDACQRIERLCGDIKPL